MSFVIDEKEHWTKLKSSKFQNSTYEKITITVAEIVPTQVSFFVVASKQKYKKENTEYHGTLLPSKNQLYSKPGNPFFLLFGWWSLVLYLHVWVSSKFYR